MHPPAPAATLMLVLPVKAAKAAVGVARAAVAAVAAKAVAAAMVPPTLVLALRRPVLKFLIVNAYVSLF